MYIDTAHTLSQHQPIHRVEIILTRKHGTWKCGSRLETMHLEISGVVSQIQTLDFAEAAPSDTTAAQSLVEKF